MTPRVRDLLGQAVVGLIAGVLVAAYVAATTSPFLTWDDRSSSVWVILPIWSLAQAWRQRSRGPVVLVRVWAGWFVVVLAYLAWIRVLATTLQPWAVTQPWIVPSIALLLAAGTAWALVRKALAEPTARGRRLAWAEAGLVVALVVGLLLVAGMGGLAGIGAVAAVWAAVGLFVILRLRAQSVLDEPAG